MLEDANIKLGDVATNVLGFSARTMLSALLAGESDPAVLAELARDKRTQLAQALAGHLKSHRTTFLGAQYRRVATRRGKRRAVIALAHTILVIIYHLLTRHEPYRDRGATYFDDCDRQAVERRWCVASNNSATMLTYNPCPSHVRGFSEESRITSADSNTTYVRLNQLEFYCILEPR